MPVTVKIKLDSVNVMLEKCGVNPGGDVQWFTTNTINRRLTRYMPFRSGALATKLKFVSDSTTITVLGPYAQYQYFGKVMVDPVTRAAGFKTKDGQWRSRRGVQKVLTDRPLDYSLSRQKNPRAGPLWDKLLMQYESKAIEREIQAYIARRGGR